MQEDYALDYDSQPTLIMRFSLTGDDLDPGEITQLLGTEPSVAWKKGEAIPRPEETRFTPRPSYLFGQWALVPKCSKYDDFETQIGQLLDKLLNLPPVITHLIEKYQGEIAIGYSSGEQTFGFHLSRIVIEKISRLGVSIDFDIYIVCPENR